MSFYQYYKFKETGAALTSVSDFTNASVGTEFVHNNGTTIIKDSSGIYNRVGIQDTSFGVAGQELSIFNPVLDETYTNETPNAIQLFINLGIYHNNYFLTIDEVEVGRFITDVATDGYIITSYIIPSGVTFIFTGSSIAGSTFMRYM